MDSATGQPANPGQGRRSRRSTSRRGAVEGAGNSVACGLTWQLPGPEELLSAVWTAAPVVSHLSFWPKEGSASAQKPGCAPETHCR
jgi:hypothetical protein